ncbi:glycosyltransferase family 4 protein [Olivibacter sitiensis]|uniref:glycosyltransferase family 4 protein n=1 Tax=Olivibacter sitiensis TaxID=376470 RepID=UPI00146FBBE7|nr:glycosyltransferase family 4 protein [Olivibacter sitiensis]
MLIVSPIPDTWGGSEELWAKAIGCFPPEAYHFLFVKSHIVYRHPKIMALQEKGVRLYALGGAERPWYKRLLSLMRRWLQPGKPWSPLYAYDQRFSSFGRLLKKEKPHLVIVAQGINYDGWPYADVCLRQGIPYVLICQKADDDTFPTSDARPCIQQVFTRAKKVFFVSEHNRQWTQRQLALSLENSERVFNPVKRTSANYPMPSLKGTVRFLCVARLFTADKGQDLLLQVLALPKWRERDIRVDFLGEGQDELALKELAAFLHLKNVGFLGYRYDVEELWRHYHALVLPSRKEGMPLSMLEAMCAGRLVVATEAGGIAELLRDGRNGFIGPPTVKGLDDALERAWKKMSQWSKIVDSARQDLESYLPKISSERYFANKIIDLLDNSLSSIPTKCVPIDLEHVF